MAAARKMLAIVVALAALAGARAACTTNPPPTANARWNCVGTASGATCTATCPNSGFTANPATATCTSANTWTVTPGCTKTCMGSLPLLPGGTWDSACSNAPFNGWCTGTCASGFGSPKIQCKGAWGNTASIIGRCSSSESVCNGLPPSVADGAWPLAASGTSTGGIATAVCKPGFLGAGSPQSVCSGSQWSTPSPRNCIKGVSSGTAFLARGKYGQFVICSVQNGRFSSCRNDTGTAGGVPALERPSDAATLGSAVWILENIYPARVHICQWSAATRSLTACTVSGLNGWTPSSTANSVNEIVVDPRTGTVYITDPQSHAIVVCIGTDCGQVPAAQFPTGSYPWGLALSPDGNWIWTTLESAIAKCPVTPAGIDMPNCVYIDLSSIDFPLPSAIAVDDTRVIVTSVFGNSTLVCPAANPSASTCVITTSDTFAGPGDVGIALSGGYAWIPNVWGQAVSVCTSSVTDCTLQITPDEGGSNIMLQGANSIWISGP